jgi:catechol 2,3-dioxygenase-like lactoylglutathione lyase family enzyme
MRSRRQNQTSRRQALNTEEKAMKRFHVHVAVDNLDESIRFYSTIFGTEPSVVKPDYAKWMLEDPKVNFAISHRGHATGVNHLGIQVESAEELAELRGQLERADQSMVEQTGAACCYARSDKYWVTDPAGIAWETFHSLGSVPVYGDDTQTSTEGAACCVPLASKKATIPIAASPKNEGSAPCCA